MKKLILLLLVGMCTVPALQAQTFSEWFKQKKTQKKYLIQQIAALQSYIGVARRGYDIAKNGLRTIGSITKGEMDLHGDFFTGLKRVNPHLRQYAGLAAIITLQVKIASDCHVTYDGIRDSGYYSDDELAYIGRVYDRLLEDCGATLDELTALSSDGSLEMSDGERMARIDLLYSRARDQYTFCRSFGNDALGIALFRAKEQGDTGKSSALHAITIE